MRTPSCPRHSFTAVDARRSHRVVVCTGPPRTGGCPGDGGASSALSARGDNAVRVAHAILCVSPPPIQRPKKKRGAASLTPPTFLDGPGGLGGAVAAGWQGGHCGPRRLLQHPRAGGDPGGSHIPLPRHALGGVGVHLHPLFPQHPQPLPVPARPGTPPGSAPLSPPRRDSDTRCQT